MNDAQSILVGLSVLGALLVVAGSATKEGTKSRTVTEALTWLMVWIGAFLLMVRKLMHAPAEYDEQF